MKRLENYLLYHSIDFTKVFNSFEIHNSYLFENLVIYKFAYEPNDFLYVYVRPKQSERAYVVNYCYLVNIVIRNFINER